MKEKNKNLNMLKELNDKIDTNMILLKLLRGMVDLEKRVAVIETTITNIESALNAEPSKADDCIETAKEIICECAHDGTPKCDERGATND